MKIPNYFGKTVLAEVRKTSLSKISESSIRAMLAQGGISRELRRMAEKRLRRMEKK